MEYGYFGHHLGASKSKIHADGGSGSSTGGSCTASTVAVTFDELVTTTYGETIKM